MNKKIYLILLKLIFCNFLIAQEICNNAIDDDLDGLIDLNDGECICNDTIDTAAPSSLIPNPSFEEYYCLPTLFSQLNCADFWIQASDPTTDYYNVNSFLPTSATHPLPPPNSPTDGDSFVGFIGGANILADNWSEYVATCLLSPLVAGNSYTFNIDLGFANDIATYFQSDTITLTFFAHPDCNAIPFAGSECPLLNNTGWVEIAATFESGDNEWLTTSVTFTPTQDFEVIAVGPACNTNLNIPTYFYLDNLVVNTSSSFLTASLDSTKIDCNEYLLTTNSDTLDVQWYNNGIALVGETNDTLLLNGIDIVGNYTAQLFSDSICTITDTISIFLDNQTTINIDSFYLDCNEYLLTIADVGGNIQWNLNGNPIVGETNDSLFIAGNIAGNYSVTYSDSICYLSNSVLINQIIAPSLSIVQGTFLSVVEGDTIQLNANTNSTNFNLNWINNTTGLSCTNCNNPTFIADEDIIFDVEIIDLNTNCTNTTSITIEVLNPCLIPGEAGNLQFTTAGFFGNNSYICFGDNVFVNANNFVLLPGQTIHYVFHDYLPNLTTYDLPIPANNIIDYGNFLNNNLGSQTIFVTAFGAIPNIDGTPNFNDPCITVSNTLVINLLAPVQIVSQENCDNDSGEFFYEFFVGGGLPQEIPSINYDVTGTFYNNPIGLLALELVGPILDGTTYEIYAVDDNLCEGSLVRSIDCIKIPIELKYFTGNKKQNYNLLQWETAAEIENDFFTLQKSTDGVNFESIATIPSKLNTTSATSYYNFNDYEINAEKTYYKLLQTDLNGNETKIDNIVLIERAQNLPFEIESILPNPTKNKVNINIASYQEEKITVKFYNILGKLVINKIQNLNVGNNTLNFEIANFGKGIYYLQINVKNKIITEKIIVK